MAAIHSVVTMDRVLWQTVVGVLCLQGVLGDSNSIPGSSRGITSGDELVSSVIDSCFDGEDPVTKCIKMHALSYLDHISGTSEEERRSLKEEEERSFDDNERLDDLVLNRMQRVLRNNQFKVQLPEFFFQEATLTFKPAQGDVDVSFPPHTVSEERSYSEARDMMKQKMLLPLLLLLKLKLKALTPIMVAMVGMKALKALILSKISILLVLGFLAAQLFKKVGMKDMMPPMMMEPATPPPSMYGPPSAPAPPVTMSSYEPSWEPSPGGPYQRNWDPQQAVYTAYVPHQQPAAPQSGPVTA